MPQAPSRLKKSRSGRARPTLVAACLLLAALSLSQTSTPAGSAEARRTNAPERGGQGPRLAEGYGQLPLWFEANRGQTDGSVKFLARGSGYTLFLTERGAVLRLRAKAAEGEERRSGTLRLVMEGASRSPKVEGHDPLPGRSNYLRGREARGWRTGVPTFGRVRYESVYRGIDAVYYGRQGRLEYDFVVAPGADPSRIRLRFDGARSTRVEENGDLVISTEVGDVRQQRPVAYQEFDGGRREVKAGYVLDKRGRVRFDLGAYDRTRELVIDPVLVYSSYLGGADADTGTSIAVDAAGSAYVAGTTSSTDFPVTGGALQTSKGDFNDAFILKLSADGRSLVYATYLGGGGDEQCNAVAVDSAGNAYLGGFTASTDFPVTAGGFQTSKSGLGDAFLSKLNPSGTALVYSTYVGGAGSEQVSSIAVDAAGAAYVAGRTDSLDFANVAGADRAGSPVYRSADGGASWGASASGLTASTVLDFAVAPSNTAVVYAATNLGVYVSADGGASWQRGGQPSPSTVVFFTRAIVVDPSNPSVVYAGTSGGSGVYKSTDGGLTFEAKANGISIPLVNTLAVHPTTPATLYAGTGFAIFKTTNGGESWTELNLGIPGAGPGANEIVIDPSNPQTVYAATPNRGVLKTTNGGTSWTQVNNGLPQDAGFIPLLRTLALDPSNPSTLFTAFSGFPTGIFKSTNGGASWVNSSAGLTATVGGQTFTPSVNAILVDPSSPSTVYAATTGYGVYKSTDGGTNWAPSNAGLANRGVLALAARPGSPGAVLAGTVAGADPFVMKFNPSGAALEYLRLLGGSESDDARSVALGPNGSAYVAGTTASPDFPTANARQPALGGVQDAFVLKLDSGGNTVYSTYLGGGSTEQGAGVAAGADGSAYVVGLTNSNDFPLANAYKSALGQNDFQDAFVTRLSPDGQALVYSTYLGGQGSDQAFGVAVGADGGAYVAGQAGSQDFPLAGSGAAFAGLSDAFVTQFNPAGSSLVYSTCFGGSDVDAANAVALDGAGGVYVAGTTSSTNLPLSNAARGTYGGGRSDAFVAKFGVEADLSVAVTDSRDPALVGSALSYTLAVNNAGPSPATGVGVTFTLPASLAYVSAAPTQGSCGVSGQVVTCALGGLAASAGASVVVNVNANAPGDATSTAVVTANEPDHTPANNGDSETTRISASPSIRGRVTAPGGAALPGVTVTLSGSQSASRQTDADGYYIFENLPAGGTYTVTPSKENVSFEPPSRTFDNLSADQFADFTGTACTWTLTPQTQSFGASGGAGSVTVNTQQGCPWTAASNTDWITVNSGASGTGSGTVTFTVAPTTAPRAGRLTIAGQNVPVYQEFDSCGAPSFSFANYLLPGSSPSRVRSADLNGDGRPDLVFSTGNTGGGIQGSVLLNDGAGRFTASAFDLGLGVPGGFDLADFNGDGRPDVAMTQFSSNYVRVFFNNGAGGFPTAVNVNFSAPLQSPGTASTRDVKAADFNRDGKADLVVSTPDSNGAQILLGDGAGGFTQAAPVGGSTFDLVLGVADVNGDGKPDLIYGGGGSNARTLSVRLGDGAGGFGAPIVSEGARVTLSVAAADFDGDGKTDIAAATVIPGPNSTPSNPTFTNGVTVMLGDGAGHFAFKSSAEAGGLPNVVAADFNKDAKPDVAYSTGGPRVTVRLGDGSGGLGAPLVTDTGGGDTFPGISGLVAADFDGDARIDIGGADYTRGGVVLRNQCNAAPHISGRVVGGSFGPGLGGVTVTLSGAAAQTTQTDEGGNYFFGGLTAGASYVVTPSKEGYRFSPAGTAVNNLPAAGQRADFTATAMTVRIAQIHYLVDENVNNALKIDVLRGGDTTGPATVNYSTGTTNVTAPASDRSDYTYAAGTLAFAPNETMKSFTVFLNDDRIQEGWEGFTVNLSDPVGAVLAAPSSVLVEIRDDEFSQPSTNPIDESEFFVRQHYHDFLNREPDAEGLAFWTNEIEQCGADQQCREVKRVNVSAAFFLSIEFQNTGYLVYKTYKAAFNSGEALAQKTFLKDTQQIGLGVVVGAPNWEQTLEANKRAYLSAFVQRADFLAAYPAAMTAAQFVDALNANTGGSLTQAERDALAAALGSGAATRAETLRAVVENEEFSRRERNRAFVLAQYFGYLRRGPSEPPDANFDGYNHWLSKLEEFNGNYIAAEMVKAFITSIEYRRRFGPQ
ncbi:MAG TPA: FG-GAP-like repeat-containing protein [Pyrinomonadaceae bacterium]|nr:FG-GAP-like repeat-containing protein [Pyrinomonadaceae bacterium]